MVIQSIEVQDWTAAGHSRGLLSSPFFQFAPWIFAGMCAAIVIQAFVTRKRYRAVDVLSSADQERVRAAIHELESTTSADIVPLVVERSDPQTHTMLLATAAFVMLGNLMLLRLLPQQGFLPLGLAELGLLALGLGFARLCPDFRRWFLSRRCADATTGEQAQIELAQLTRGKDSPAVVLLFVSLLEHRVVVLANSPVAGAVAPEHWPKVVQAVLAGVRQGQLADGIVSGINACAGQMTLAFPPSGERANYFADRAIVRRE